MAPRSYDASRLREMRLSQVRHRATGRHTLRHSNETPSPPAPLPLFDGERGGFVRASKSRLSGEGGIRTRGRDLTPYTGLANRRYRPLSHLSGAFRLVDSPFY